MEFPKQKILYIDFFKNQHWITFVSFYRIKLANTMPSILNKSGLRKISWPN